jgi:hypothetical protein
MHEALAGLVGPRQLDCSIEASARGGGWNPTLLS